MRNRFLRAHWKCAAALLGAALALGAWASPAEAKIEAVKGKVYRLTSRHGPWMIMVTSLWGETADQREHARDAANELVYQLRRKGIPAYIYEQDSETESFRTMVRGRELKGKYTSQNAMIGVLAGNYPTIGDSKGQKTLRYVKKFQPRISVETAAGPRDVPMLFNKAFLTRNPLLPAEELARKERDPLLQTLNSGVEHSLLENPGKYTLVVASFYGESEVQHAGRQPLAVASFYSEPGSHNRPVRGRDKQDVTLDKAALESWQLAKTMREQGLDAYVYHERFRSIVTVGSFRAPDDPEIGRLKEAFRAKYTRNPTTGAEVLVAESIQIPSPSGGPPLRAWWMDPVPELIEVPGP